MVIFGRGRRYGRPSDNLWENWKKIDKPKISGYKKMNLPGWSAACGKSAIFFVRSKVSWQFGHISKSVTIPSRIIFPSLWFFSFFSLSHGMVNWHNTIINQYKYQDNEHGKHSQTGLAPRHLTCRHFVLGLGIRQPIKKFVLWPYMALSLCIHRWF